MTYNTKHMIEATVKVLAKKMTKQQMGAKTQKVLNIPYDHRKSLAPAGLIKPWTDS